MAKQLCDSKWQSSCVIANRARKTAKAILFVQGYNLEVYDVIKRKHRATVTNYITYITCKPGFCVT